MNSCDSIIIGAGHNGLVCACYLAKAGRKVVVIERRPVVGGAVCTQEVFPGYKIDVGSSVHFMIHHTPIVAELKLSEYGLEYIEMDPWASLPLGGGKSLSFYNSLERTCESIAHVSKRDSDTYRKFVTNWAPMANGVFKAFQEPPTVASFGRHVILAKSPGVDTVDGLRTILMGYGQLIKETFESTEMRAAMSWLAAQSGPPPGELGGAPFAGWYAAVHGVGAKRARGGSGMLSVALRRAFEAMGGEVRVNAPVQQILVEKSGSASGVILESGEVIRSKSVIAACHATTAFTKLLAPESVPPTLLNRIKNARIGNGFGMTVRATSSKLPDYGDGFPAEIHNGMQLLCPSLDYLETAYADYVGGMPSLNPPVIAMTFTAIDPSLAPVGKHIVQCWSQYFPYKRSDGRSWDSSAKDEAADSILQTLYEYAPNMRGSIEQMFVQTPLDLERELGLLHGNVMHYEMSLDQMFAMRPLPELAQYKTPIAGLFLTGASTHPGGGVFGASGRSAAKVVLKYGQ